MLLVDCPWFGCACEVVSPVFGVDLARGGRRFIGRGRWRVLGRRRRTLSACKCRQSADNGQMSDHWTFLPLRPADNACGKLRVSAVGGSGGRCLDSARSVPLRWPSRLRSGSRVEHRTDKPELSDVFSAPCPDRTKNRDRSLIWKLKRWRRWNRRARCRLAPSEMWQ